MAQAYDADVTTDSGSKPQGSDASGRFGRFGRFRRFGDGMWRRGIVIAVLAVAVAVVMAFHGSVPNRVGNLGSLLETFLPWIGLAIPLLLVAGLLRRSATALIAGLLPIVVWLHFFGGLVSDKHSGGGDLTVVTHNVNVDNPDPAGTARDLIASGADLVALEEIAAGQVSVYESALKARYPFHSVQGTVGLWSRYPLTGVRPVDTRLGWTRALRATAATPHGKVAVYVAHLPSVRVKFNAGFTAGQRDRSADALGEAIADEKLPDVILMGDLNGTMNDRALANVTSQMRSTQGAAGRGFGFSWPADFPMARIDQILVKGAEPTDSWVLPATNSDHRPVAAKVALS
ncbi:endonuclease/exonuclease/phosphatase family protein [Streptomyces sp. NPDC026673]|uniref:endonuclease/exonuclease/phosphatase family protein n=1 Tax=Streptomyces sp. NPDC026673 TaxID=3155724 RepID=UPI0033CDEB03